MDVTVLLVAAERQDAKIVTDALVDARGTSFEVQHLEALPDDLGWLADGGAAVVLLDLALPEVGGIGPLDRLLLAAPHVPVLVFTTAGDEARARQAVQRGAQDYLLRSHLDGYSLPRALHNVIDRKAADEALFLERERAQITLDSIGDAVVSTDLAGNIIYLNLVAQKMTGWSEQEAKGRPFGEVLRIVDGTSRKEPVRSPMARAIEQNKAVGLTRDSVLVRRDGVECAIEDSAAPIHDRKAGVVGAVMVFRDVSEARAQALKLSHQAQHDFLTGLPNPVLLNERLVQLLALARRHGRQLAVLFIDLDHFKRVNDSLGHPAGDKLLQSVALRVKECVRGSDPVSRNGGDEFVVVLSEIARPEDAARIAEKILAAIAAPHRIAGQDLAVTASVGIAIFPVDGVDPAELLRAADGAMYQSKKSGRNRYWFVTPEVKSALVSGASLSDLARLVC